MAKIKTNPDNEVTETQVIEDQGTEVQEVKTAVVEASEKVAVPQPSQKEKEDLSQPEPEVAPQVRDILKSYSIYEMLYIDKHGGVFTPDTLQVIRKNAVLYKNPFYKP